MALIMRCLLTVVSVVTRQFGSLSIYLFILIQNSLARTVFTGLKLRNVLNTDFFLLHTTFLPRDAMQARSMLPCSLSVRPSDTFVDHVKTNKHIFEIFSPSGSDTILVFPHQRGCRHSDGNPPNGGVECKGV